MFLAYHARVMRPTMDVDLLEAADNSVEAIIAIVKAVCAQDGLVFDADSVGGELIVEDADYEGVCIRFEACSSAYSTAGKPTARTRKCV
jgi:hypothetical protein